MPPKVKFDREKVVEAAFHLAREKGMEGLNARAIAQKAGCSTQPLYRELAGMDALRHAVMEKAGRYFESFITAHSTIAPYPYLSTGLAYLRFAREEPQLFFLLFMRKRTPEEQAKTGADDTFEYASRQIAAALHYPLEKARKFHYHSFVYVHGLAAMIATGFMPYDEESLIQLLRHQYKALRLAFETHSEQ